MTAVLPRPSCRLRGLALALPLAALPLAAVPLAAVPARAADTLAELPTGGLAFKGVGEAILESQDLTVSPDRVTILYRLANPGTAPATPTVTFALPEVDLSDPDVAYAYPTDDPVNFLAAALKVDGKPVPLPLVQRARLAGKDVTEVLRRARLPLLPLGRFQGQVAALAPAERSKLAEAGLLSEQGNDVDGNPLYAPAWSVTTQASRKLALAPGAAMTLELRYRNSTGLGQDTVFRKALRTEKGLAAEVARQRAAYCVDDGFLNGVDKLAAGAEANVAKLQERRLAHRLVERDADPFPAREFRLVVDKGAADRLVSFCFDNLKKISPTAFEMRAQNFVPDRDLKVLIVGRLPVPRKPKPDDPYSAAKQTAPVVLPPPPAPLPAQGN